MNKYYRLAAEAQKRADAILAKAKAEGRDMTDEEATAFETATAEFTDNRVKGDKLRDSLATHDQATADVTAGLDRRAAPPPPPPAAAIALAASIEVGIPEVLRDPRFGLADAEEFICNVIAAGSAAKLGNPFRSEKFARIGEAFHSVRAAAGASTFIGADGGFLVPPEFASGVFSRQTPEDLPIIGQCQRFAITGNSLAVPAVDDYDRSSSSYRNGGVIVYWPGEGGEITASKVKTRMIEFRTHKMAVLSYATSELLRQAVNFESILMPAILSAIRDEMIEVIMFGSGAGKPLGGFAATNPALVAVAIESGPQTTDTVVAANINKMYYRLFAAVRAGSAFYHNSEVGPQLDAMTVDIGASAIPIYMPPGGMADAPWGRLKGRAAYESEHCLALGDQGDICYGNFNQYGLVTYGSDVPRMDISIHLRFNYDETAFRATFELDGRPLWDKPMVPRKGAAANTLSPFVTLATR